MGLNVQKINKDNFDALNNEFTNKNKNKSQNQNKNPNQNKVQNKKK
jgi:hypothetical protein